VQAERARKARGIEARRDDFRIMVGSAVKREHRKAEKLFRIDRLCGSEGWKDLVKIGKKEWR